MRPELTFFECPIVPPCCNCMVTLFRYFVVTRLRSSVMQLLHNTAVRLLRYSPFRLVRNNALQLTQTGCPQSIPATHLALSSQARRDPQARRETLGWILIERLVPCVNRAGILNSDDLFRSRTLLDDSADCGKRFPLSEFQLFLYHVVA